MSRVAALEQAFRKALGLPSQFEVEQLEYRAIPEWDSLAHMALVNELESVFDVMFDTEEVIAMSSFTKAKEILGKHGVDFAT